MKRAILVDEKCVELARHFLSDFALSDEHDIEELAERFQATAESFCELAFNVPQAPDPRDPDPSRPGIFRDHNCYRCKDGAEACVTGGSNRCPYPHARND